MSPNPPEQGTSDSKWPARLTISDVIRGLGLDFYEECPVLLPDECELDPEKHKVGASVLELHKRRLREAEELVKAKGDGAADDRCLNDLRLERIESNPRSVVSDYRRGKPLIIHPRHSDFLLWPPDVFAMCGLLLELSGAYRRAVSPPGDDTTMLSELEAWRKFTEGIGSLWANYLFWGWDSDPKTMADRENILPNQEYPKWDWSIPQRGLRWRQEEGIAERASRINARNARLLHIRESRKVGQLRLRKPLEKLWMMIWERRYSEVRAIEYDETLWPWILRLFCIADSACEGIGRFPTSEHDGTTGLTPVSLAGSIWLIQQREGEETRRRVQYLAHLETKSSDDDPENYFWHGPEYLQSTLCRRIDPSRIVVLPKLRTPQRGITLRSLSLHLALIHGSEVTTHWIFNTKLLRSKSASLQISLDSPSNKYRYRDRLRGCETHNILLIPYPYQISPSQFMPMQEVPGIIPGGRVARLENRFDDAFAMFSYSPMDLNPFQIRITVQQLVAQARNLVGRVHGVVMPEACLNYDTYTLAFQGDWAPKGLEYMVCGVSTPPHSNRLGRNFATIQLFDDTVSSHINSNVVYIQPKHHRWALDKSQLNTYGLSGMLSPQKVWWEGIHIPPRRLNLFSLTTNCFFSVLICEDLARPDPIGSVLRAVGPNLVIALLQDGPQLRERWAGRFTVPLADDPGAAVLSLTSLGMSQLSRPSHELDDHADRTVAMFREPGGVAKEIALPHGAEALVLTLTEQDGVEFSADGRRDRTNAGSLNLGGVLAFNSQGAVYP